MENPKTIKVHPNSAIGKLMVESVERKRIIKAHVEAGKPLEELIKKGYRFAKPV